jgi:cadmium resistance protein CadD (predicted permease)
VAIDDLQALITALVLVPFAYAATNVDNLLIMASLSAGRASRGHLVVGFVVASCTVLLIASMAVFIDRLVPPEVLGYLGLVPISIGTYLLLFSGAEAQQATSRTATWPAVSGLLLANSGDTIFAIGPMFAESGSDARLGLALGFALTAAVWLFLILGASKRVARSVLLSRLGYRLAPWMMVLVGLYILSDSATARSLHVDGDKAHRDLAAGILDREVFAGNRESLRVLERLQELIFLLHRFGAHASSARDRTERDAIARHGYRTRELVAARVAPDLVLATENHVKFLSLTRLCGGAVQCDKFPVGVRQRHVGFHGLRLRWSLCRPFGDTRRVRRAPGCTEQHGKAKDEADVFHMLNLSWAKLSVVNAERSSSGSTPFISRIDEHVTAASVREQETHRQNHGEFRLHGDHYGATGFPGIRRPNFCQNYFQ